jgi:hypothetical protein
MSLSKGQAMEYRSARQMAKEFKKYGGFSWCGGPCKERPTNAKQRRYYKRMYLARRAIGQEHL